MSQSTKPIVGNQSKVYLTAVSDPDANGSPTAPTSADVLDGIKKVSIKVNGKKVDISNHKNASDGWMRELVAFKSGSVDLDGQLIRGDAPQQLLRTIGGYVNVWHEEEPTNSTTGDKGTRFTCLVESYTEENPHDEVINFTATLSMYGAPVAI